MGEAGILTPLSDGLSMAQNYIIFVDEYFRIKYAQPENCGILILTLLHLIKLKTITNFIQRYSMMKYLLFLFFFSGSIIPSMGYGQTGVSNKIGQGLSLVEKVYDFGKIPQGKPVEHRFQVINSTNHELIINNVHASCGCTTPEWSHEAIPAGGKSEVKVGYNAANVGNFEKTITIQFGNNGQTEVISIKGYVWPIPEAPAPLNQAVATLKTIKQLNTHSNL